MPENFTLVLYLFTAGSSGFNALYFFSYSSPLPRRVIGARVLGITCLALFAESLYSILTAFLSQSSFLPPSTPWIVAKLLTFSGSALITALIARRLIASRENHA